MLCALIMAGGKGTRFWPLSTEEKPKQFLNLIGNKTMIQMTVDRIKPIIPLERIFICTGSRYVDLVKAQLSDLPDRNIIVEPEPRNTAPCICLSALVIKRYFSSANMLVLPSDHLISQEDKFRDIVSSADSFVDNNKNAIVTLGIKPTRAEVGYGYIKCNCYKTGNERENSILEVESFVEKPDQVKAEKYLNDGGYLWNSGMFIWNIDSILKKIGMYMPKTLDALKDVWTVSNENFQKLINEKYSFTESTSIDYGILEKDKEIRVIPCEIGWDDVGSWNALDRYREKDKHGNIVLGETIQIGSINNIVVSKNKKIVINNVKDIYVIEGEKSIIIGKRNEIDKVKNLKERVGL